MEIRQSNPSDKIEIENIHITAFGKEEGPEIVELVNGLFSDRTALPLLSLVAVENEKILGHILFTKVEIMQTTESVSARILAPLAVLPGFQNQGVGGRLIKEGLYQLKQTSVELVFVLGHPDYYPRSGFTPAGVLGFQAPYPIPDVHAGAWMVQELSAGVIGKINGTIKCCEVLDQPQYWRE